MPKKIIKHEKISDEKQRKKVYNNRSQGLLKKVNELSILCGIDAAVVIHKRDENNATLWPSPEIYMDRMQKFLNFSTAERERKMVTHDKFLDQRVVEESRNLFKSQKTNEILEGELVTDELTNGRCSYEQLDIIHMNNMNSLADDMLERIDKIIYDNQHSSEVEQPPPNPISFVMPPPVPNLSSLEDLLSWSDTWFDDLPMTSEQGGGGGFTGSKAMIDDGGPSSSNVMNATPPFGK
ncbi:agamous-like MADS-box protein AGL80 [Primulina tabacum]|uniref:agamous-like MADS-box protein AGL80 n=1 Tax=Primulina tabacum TaxID=48773 RepID=UPI003F59A843